MSKNWRSGICTVRDLVDDTGTHVEHRTYDAFGNILSDNNPAIDFLFSYTAREWDSDAGLQYNRARWYDASTGRWLNQDPIGFFAGDTNLYRYVGNDPVNATDPSGLQQNKNKGRITRKSVPTEKGHRWKFECEPSEKLRVLVQRLTIINNQGDNAPKRKRNKPGKDTYFEVIGFIRPGESAIQPIDRGDSWTVGTVKQTGALPTNELVAEKRLEERNAEYGMDDGSYDDTWVVNDASSTIEYEGEARTYEVDMRNARELMTRFGNTEGVRGTADTPTSKEVKISSGFLMGTNAGGLSKSEALWNSNRHDSQERGPTRLQVYP